LKNIKAPFTSVLLELAEMELWPAFVWFWPTAQCCQPHKITFHCMLQDKMNRVKSTLVVGYRYKFSGWVNNFRKHCHPSKPGQVHALTQATSQPSHND
jgi:hypothetical protein